MPDPHAVYSGRRRELGRLRLLSSGKVRDIYAVGEDRLLFVTSDRVSAFDVVMPQAIPHKGRVLTALAAHWFRRTADVVANHLVATEVDELPPACGISGALAAELAGRVMLVKRCTPTPVEWVVRGHIVGSGWKEYQRTGTVCGIPLPRGLEFCQRLPAPLLTPTSKDETHDLPLTPAEAEARVGSEIYARAASAALALFQRGREELARIGILLADTKFEFGTRNGDLLLIDEALTPDSSRFWPADRFATGRNQPSYDKQLLRDWLESLDWDKRPPAPDLPPEIVRRLSERYLEICEKITGRVPAGVTA
ncbi:MAG: phosphoribosylaminoimidazolesuccinocarboxamide synthase [Planctomycetota bacterium]